MRIFLAVSVAAWLVVLWLSCKAIAAMGLAASGDVFWADFAHPWRAQFNGDFACYLVGAGIWILYREPRRLVGVSCAAAAIAFGGIFFFGYLAVATWLAKQDARALLLGPHRGATGGGIGAAHEPPAPDH